MLYSSNKNVSPRVANDFSIFFFGIVTWPLCELLKSPSPKKTIFLNFSLLRLHIKLFNFSLYCFLTVAHARIVLRSILVALPRRVLFVSNNISATLEMWDRARRVCTQFILLRSIFILCSFITAMLLKKASQMNLSSRMYPSITHHKLVQNVLENAARSMSWKSCSDLRSLTSRRRKRKMYHQRRRKEIITIANTINPPLFLRKKTLNADLAIEDR